MKRKPAADINNNDFANVNCITKKFSSGRKPFSGPVKEVLVEELEGAW